MNEFKNSSRTERDPASSSLFWQTSLANQRIVSLIFIAEALSGEKKKRKEKAYSLCSSLLVPLNPLTVTLLDFRNLRPGVKMAACGESSHPCRLPRCRMLGRAKTADRRRACERDCQAGSEVKALVQNKRMWLVNERHNPRGVIGRRAPLKSGVAERGTIVFCLISHPPRVSQARWRRAGAVHYAKQHDGSKTGFRFCLKGSWNAESSGVQRFRGFRQITDSAEERKRVAEGEFIHYI